eukprot:TRINITY_DN7127_c0_g1_i1.p1 TRINITY_DN7127_c0_g1~~TRINITY_DN7127_c0_g1_i1.p1  ORF type:complete len:1071 (+),score=211.66 TRINITY_DN7127_c0_g1_i1:316-3213(+)
MDAEGKVSAEVVAEDTDGPAPALQPSPPRQPPGANADGDEDASGGHSKWTGLRCAVQMTRKRVAGLFKHPSPGSAGVVNPLKDALINYGNREVDVAVVREILEENKSTIETWIDLPLDCDGLSVMPSALIFAVGYTQADVVATLCEYGANPKLGYHGNNSFNGWVKPGLPPSEIVMNRVGRFKGTMLGEDLQKILEALQAAEIRLASASVQNIAQGIQSEGAVSDIYEIQGAIPGIEADNIKLAVHKKSSEAFAIKTESKNQEAGIWEELAIMRKVAHHNIIKLQCTFEDESSVHIVMDLCSGGHLFPRIAEAGGMNKHVTCRFMQQMSAAVAYLHEQGICHRNIEPSNFLVKEPGTTMLLHDATVMLGGSWWLREFSSNQPMKIDDNESCILQCVAPELLATSGSMYSEKVDVWSLGVVFFILLSGSCPFVGDSERTVLKRIKKGAIYQTEYWANVQSPAQHLVQQMLTVDTQVRLTALQVVAHPYFQGNSEKDEGQSQHTSEQLDVLFDFQARKICLDSHLLRDIAPKTSLSVRRSKVQQDIVIVHPLENIFRAKKINVKQLRAVLESMDDVSNWIDSPLDTSEENPLPPALIFALAKSQPDLVEALLEHGADPFLQHKGSSSYCGWIKPDTKLSELVIGRRGRFIGTMVGEKLLKICELLQLAEAKKATAHVHNIMGKLTHTLSDPATVYNIEGIIGQSKTSVTKKGVLKSSGEGFAIKTEAKTSQADVWEELSIIQSLSHTNIIKLRETFEDQTSLYAILELCEGGSVASKLVDAQVPFLSPEREGIEKVMLQMGSAVEYIHSKSIAHRSLQPEHFLLLENAGPLGDVNVKLIDFTFARDFGPNGRKMTTRVCVPYYVAPEILIGDGVVAYSEKADVWSLGVTFYAMTACAQPFDPTGEDAEEDILQKVENGDFNFNLPEEWPAQLAQTRDLISKMLVVDVGGRLAASQVVAHACFTGEAK